LWQALDSVTEEKLTMKARKSAPRQLPVTADVPPEPRNRLLARRTLPPGDAIDRRVVTVNLAESPLAWLARRNLVSAAQFEASERLRHDFLRAGQAPRITMRWDPAPGGRGGGSGLDPTTAQISARQRFDAAVAAAGPGLSDVLWRVICLGEGLETAERALGWPNRAGKLVLKLALDRLVAHYGIRTR
jgi:hypothetical protein